MTVATVDAALVLMREHGGALHRWPDGYWSPADPAAHLASAVGDMAVRVDRVPPMIARAIATTYQVDDGVVGVITLKGRDR